MSIDIVIHVIASTFTKHNVNYSLLFRHENCFFKAELQDELVVLLNHVLIHILPLWGYSMEFVFVAILNTKGGWL
jgi:hypothetical protein